MFDVLKTQQKLVKAALPYSFEQSSGELLAELARPLCDEMWFDEIGNLICHIPGPGKKILFCAHRDVIGFMVRDITETGAVKLMAVGGQTASELLHTVVRFENGTVGVIRSAVDGLPDSMKDIYCDIGAVTREEAEELVSIGDVAVFKSPTFAGTGDTIITPYADDLSGCIAILRAMEQVKAPENDCYFAFTVREESGCHGADVLGKTLYPDVGIAVDVTDALDEVRSEEPKNVKLGGGVVIGFRDGSIHNPLVIKTLCRTAEELGMEYQSSAMPYGGTDASGLTDAHNGIPTSVLSIPCRGMHSPTEIYSVSDIDSTARLIVAAASASFPTFSTPQEDVK